jgi:deoxyribodipyrimidine photo-lyase
MGGLYESAAVWLWSKPDHYISVEEINELETVFEKADLATVPDTIFQKGGATMAENTSRLFWWTLS